MDQGDEGGAAHALHGLWPLVADPSAATGVRFADLSRDPAGSFVSDATQLPAFELVLRTFYDDVQRAAWLAGAAEFGGNAFAAVLGPGIPGSTLRFALVARPDREVERRPGSLDAAIPLVRDQERDGYGRRGLQDLAALGSQARDRVLGDAAAARRASDWRTRWAAEIAALSAVPEVRPDDGPPKAGGSLHFNGGLLARDGNGLRAVGEMPRGKDLDADLSDRFAAAAAGLGWRLRPEGHVERGLPALDAAAAQALAADLGSLRAQARRLSVIQEARTTLLALHVDPESLRVLRRMAEGFPLASERSSDPAAQIAPRTGKPVTVAASRVERLFRAGLIEPRWWTVEAGGHRQAVSRSGSRPTQTPSLFYLRSILWGLTRTGRAFLADGFEAAAETQAEDAATAQMWRNGLVYDGGPVPMPHSGLPDAVARMPRPPEAARATIAAALRAELRTRWFPRGPDRVALLGAALAAGVATSDGKTVEFAEDVPAPAPGIPCP